MYILVGLRSRDPRCRAEHQSRRGGPVAARRRRGRPAVRRPRQPRSAVRPAILTQSRPRLCQRPAPPLVLSALFLTAQQVEGAFGRSIKAQGAPRCSRTSSKTKSSPGRAGVTRSLGTGTGVPLNPRPFGAGTARLSGRGPARQAAGAAAGGGGDQPQDDTRAEALDPGHVEQVGAVRQRLLGTGGLNRIALYNWKKRFCEGAETNGALAEQPRRGSGSTKAPSSPHKQVWCFKQAHPSGDASAWATGLLPGPGSARLGQHGRTHPA